MGNRTIQQKMLKIKNYKRRKSGRLSKAQIMKDRVDGLQFINTGRGPVAAEMQMYKARAGGTLFRTRTGEIFVAKDMLDEYFASKFATHRYTEAEIIGMGKANTEGWKTAEATPLGAVKEHILRLTAAEDIQKWRHFSIRREDHIHIDLFFSPTKDRWFYIWLDPITGIAQRSTIIGSKEVAEFKRTNHKLTWVPLTNPELPIRI